jgi:hypothetical protein
MGQIVVHVGHLGRAFLLEGLPAHTVTLYLGGQSSPIWAEKISVMPVH